MIGSGLGARHTLLPFGADAGAALAGRGYLYLGVLSGRKRQPQTPQDAASTPRLPSSG